MWLFLVQAQGQQPALIDRQAFFGEIQTSGAHISPDGRQLAFLKPFKGVRNIWWKKADEPFSAAKPMSADLKRPITAFLWSRDSKYLIYAQDAGGDENFNVYAIDPTQAVDPQTGVPPARALTELKGVRTQLYSAPRKKPDMLYIGLNDRDKRFHDLYELQISTGRKTLLKQNTDQVSNWVFDNDGVLRAATRTLPSGDQQILRVEQSGLVPIYTCSVFEECSPSGFDAENRLMYLITNKGDHDLTELDTLDVQTGATAKVESDPENKADLAYVQTSDVDHRILFTIYTYDREKVYVRDKRFANDWRWLEARLPGMIARLGSASADENVWIVNAESDVEPGVTYLWNRKEHKLDLQFRIRDEIPRASLAHMQTIRYKSSDGLEIPAYLTLPAGLPPKNLPMVVYPHGGPWGRDYFGFDSFAQFLANRGYAVLQPNFRASTGYGKKFLNAGNGQWGRLMQDDVTWGVKYLEAQGTVDPKRVGIFGISYGGYATLAGVTFTPDLYAAAVAYSAPANLITLLGTIPPYWEAMRKSLYTRMADPTTADGRQLLTAESPVAHADAIVTPLLVIQGKNDPRVKVQESQQIIVAVRDKGKPVGYMVAPDEGHVFNRAINKVAVVAAMEQFFAEHLGGREQKDVPADVQNQLKLLTMDVKTVSLTASQEQP